jgi:hypothetical protein
MAASIWYCGDTSLRTAASYLAGLLTDAGWNWEYVASDQPLMAATVATPPRLVIFSDYPAARLSAEMQQQIVEWVRAGTGLLMIGGWESYHGLGGDWDRSAIAAVLPAEVHHEDDRVNFAQSAFVSVVNPHPCVSGLPWEACPPAIGGLNRVTARAGSTTVLAAHPLKLSRENGVWSPVWERPLPLLVVGTKGLGRVAAITTDVAPHWVGGLVDWGDRRVSAQAIGGEAIEVGNWYAQFWQQLLAWTGQLSPRAG